MLERRAFSYRKRPVKHKRTKETTKKVFSVFFINRHTNETVPSNTLLYFRVRSDRFRYCSMSFYTLLTFTTTKSTYYYAHKEQLLNPFSRLFYDFGQFFLLPPTPCGFHFCRILTRFSIISARLSRFVVVPSVSSMTTPSWFKGFSTKLLCWFRFMPSISLIFG